MNEPTRDKPTMDYKQAAEDIRAGAADLPMITSVLAELLDTLVPDTLAEESEPTQADAVYPAEPTQPIYPSSDEHPETLTLPKSDA